MFYLRLRHCTGKDTGVSSSNAKDDMAAALAAASNEHKANTAAAGSTTAKPAAVVIHSVSCMCGCRRLQYEARNVRAHATHVLLIVREHAVYANANAY
eukprot:21204-Heterococcus_DN1.PRE.9